MPRARTGTVVYAPPKPGERFGHYRIRVTANDGTRPWRDLQPGPKSKPAEKRARETAASYSLEVRKADVGAAPQRRTKASLARAKTAAAGETVSAWSDRWFDERALRGLANVELDRGTVRKWILSRIGPRPIASITTEDLEDLVDDLDARVRAEELRWKTAINIWGLASKMFADACNAKARALRVLDRNPAAGVRGPDRGQARVKAWLHPAEVLRLLEDDGEGASATLGERRALALQVYLYTRPGELRALRWDDVDLEAGVVRVRQVERRDGTVTSTKTKTARTVPIEPTIAPLLEAMHEEAAGEGRVCPGIPKDTELADVLHRMLRGAGVDRADLLETDATRKRVTWYDLRATGITWRAIRGDDPLKIMHQAGHKEFKTTQIYIREAEAIGADFGETFPPLPASLLGPGNRPPKRPKAGKSPKSLWVDRDSNPENSRRSASIEGDSRKSISATSTARDVQVRDVSSAQTFRDESIDVEGKLVDALSKAAAAGRFDVVAQLARELEARRLAGAGAPEPGGKVVDMVDGLRRILRREEAKAAALDAERAAREGRRS